MDIAKGGSYSMPLNHGATLPSGKKVERESSEIRQRLTPFALVTSIRRQGWSELPNGCRISTNGWCENPITLDDRDYSRSASATE